MDCHFELVRVKSGERAVIYMLGHFVVVLGVLFKTSM